MARQKVAVFSAQYFPHMGGVEQFTSGIAGALIRKGYDVTVVTNDTDLIGAGDSIEDGVNVLRLPCLAFLNGRLPLPIPSKTRSALCRELWNKKFDGVIVNTRFYPHSILGMKLAKKNGVTPIVLEHGSSFVPLGSPVLDMTEHAYERLITRVGQKYSPDYYGVSIKSAEWLHEFSIIARGVVHNSIDAQGYQELASSRQWRRELGIDKSVFLLVFAGRLIGEKGLDSLLDALNLLKEGKGDYCLAIAGTGPMEERARQTESEHCHYVGRLSRPDLSALLAEADCLCLPTRYPEGLPTVLLEAAAQHAAIIVSDCAGAREVVPDEAFGTVLSETTPETIANAIDDYREDPERLERCKVKTSERVETLFSWDDSAEKLIDAMFQSDK